MSGTRLLGLAAFSIILSVFVTGCGGGTQMALKFEANDTTTYRYTAETLNDYKFEQPSLNKVDARLTGSNFDITYVQQIETVDSQGNAVAKITVKDIKYQVKGKEGVTFDFDSARQSDKSEPFTKLIGQSYKIQIALNGEVKVLDAASIRNVIKSGSDAKRAKAFFSDKIIARRHAIQSLPDTSESITAGHTWSKTVTPGYRLMVPKTFEKTYTVAKIKDGGQAVIEMNAVALAKTASDAEKSSSGIGIFANMFNGDEAYTGNTVIDTNTGKIRSHSENLIATYNVSDTAEEQRSDKGPDAVTVVLTYTKNIKAVD